MSDDNTVQCVGRRRIMVTRDGDEIVLTIKLRDDDLAHPRLSLDDARKLAALISAQTA